MLNKLHKSKKSYKALLIRLLPRLNVNNKEIFKKDLPAPLRCNSLESSQVKVASKYNSFLDLTIQKYIGY